jgi:hypothetical protein
MGGVGSGQSGSYLPLCGRPLEVELSLPLRLLLLAHRWRTKQNLDYCFLMMYAQSKGIYYVQVSLKLFFCPLPPPRTLSDLSSKP